MTVAFNFLKRVAKTAQSKFGKSFKNIRISSAVANSFYARALCCFNYLRNFLVRFGLFRDAAVMNTARALGLKISFIPSYISWSRLGRQSANDALLRDVERSRNAIPFPFFAWGN